VLNKRELGGTKDEIQICGRDNANASWAIVSQLCTCTYYPNTCTYYPNTCTYYPNTCTYPTDFEDWGYILSEWLGGTG
jgi:hypothetical protein